MCACVCVTAKHYVWSECNWSTPWPLLTIRWKQHIAGHTSTLTTEVHIFLQDSKTFLNTQSLSDVLSLFPDHEPKTHRCATIGPWLNSEHPYYVLQGPWPQTAWRRSVNSQGIWKLKLFLGLSPSQLDHKHRSSNKRPEVSSLRPGLKYKSIRCWFVNFHRSACFLCEDKGGRVLSGATKGAISRCCLG